MLSYLLKTTLCWSLFYLFYHLWLGKETFFKVNRWYLLSTVLLGMLIPLIDFQWFIPVKDESMALNYLPPISVGVDQLEAVIITSSSDAGFDWWGLLIKVYWLGAVIAFGRFLSGLLKINKLYGEGERSEADGYQFIMTAACHVPFSFFKNLFWSKNFEVDEEDRQNILRHEEAHIFQHHSVDVILFEILGVVFWCSPFLYLYKKAIKTIHEYLADDYVVAQASRKKYGKLLLRQSQSLPQGHPWGIPIAISNSLFSSQLKNRIVMMTKNKSNKSASLKYLATLPLLALLFLVFSFQNPNRQKIDDPDKDGLKIQTPKDTVPHSEVFKVVEEMPAFSGCAEITDIAERKKCSDEKMLEFIFNNLKYPKEAKEKGTEGMVVATFIIEKDGSVTDAKIARSVSESCDDETLRVIKAMPNWSPGKQRGRVVRVQYNLPIQFKLDETNKKTKPGSPNNEIFKVVEEMPRFPGCEDLADANEKSSCSQKMMFEFIFSNIKYPKEAREKGVEGMAVVQFVVEKDGSIASAEIVRSVGNGCDEEVLRVIGDMPKWIAGKKDGKPVAVELKLPIKFSLNDEDKVIGKDDATSAVLKAFPNPATDKLSLYVKLDPGNYQLTITDLNGKVVLSKIIQNSDGNALTITDLPVKDVTRGTLYVTIKDEKGKVIKSTSVVLQ